MEIQREKRNIIYKRIEQRWNKIHGLSAEMINENNKEINSKTQSQIDILEKENEFDWQTYMFETHHISVKELNKLPSCEYPICKFSIYVLPSHIHTTYGKTKTTLKRARKGEKYKKYFIKDNRPLWINTSQIDIDADA